MLGLRRTRWFLPLLPTLSTLAGCGATPPPPPPRPVAAEPQPVAVAAPPPLAPARWVRTGGATAVGPTMPGGTLVLLGGRRALVAKDGTVKTETALSPEPILEIVEVPNPAGERRLVGRGLHGIYRFDEPLGRPTELARSDVELRGIGGGPGLIAVWDTQSDVPRLIDAETGQPAKMQGMPELPLRALAFRSPKEGAAVFAGGGLAITADGGATFRPASDTSPGDALRVSALRLRGDDVRARTSNEGREGVVDLGQARLGPFADVPAADGEPATLRWIRATGRDPLEAAIASGVELPGAAAIVASHGLLARVDTSTGVVQEIVEFAKGSGVNACGGARAGDVAWVACALSEGSERDLYDPFGIMRVPLGGAALTIEPPTLSRNGESELRTSPSGGVMLVGPCSADEQGDACVRQPGGKWATIHSDVELIERGAGPLADGRVAFLRGMFEGDEPHGDDGTEAKPGPRRPHVSVLDPAGKEQPFAPPGFGGDMHGDLRLSGHLEEDADRAVRFVVDDERGPKVVVQPQGREAAPAMLVPGATHVRLRGGRGIAFGKEVQQSIDGGTSWTVVPAPARIAETVTRLGPSIADQGVLVVGDVGVQLDSELRVGWGLSDDPREEPREPGSAVLPARPAATPAGPEQMLTCTSEGPSTGTAALEKAQQIAALLGPAQKPTKGTKRTVSTSNGGRGAGVLEGIGMLEEQGPDKPGSAPASWTLRFHDPSEPLSRPRTLSGAPPKGTAWGASLRNVAIAGSRALFTIRAGGKYLLARAKGGGFETAEVGSELLPSAEVAFGAERGEPIAWIHDASLVVWISGEAPRVIASIGTQAPRVVGEPARDGVPVLLMASDWTLLHTFAIPPEPRPPAEGGKAPPVKAPKAPPPPPPVLTGWAPAPNMKRDLTRLAACSPKSAAAKGARFHFSRTARTAFSIDKLGQDSNAATYEVRVAGLEACVSSISGTFNLSSRPSAPIAGAVATQAGQKPAPKGPVGFVRADLGGKKAEGGDRGVAGAQVRRLACSLGVK